MADLISMICAGLLAVLALALLTAYNAFGVEARLAVLHRQSPRRSKIWQGVSGTGSVICAVASMLVGVV